MRTLRTGNTHTFKIEPDHVGGRTQTATFPKEQVVSPPANKKKKKTASDHYLLIGFDTEYQVIAPVKAPAVRAGEAEAKNEVLSYQFCVKRISKNDEKGSPHKHSGIIIPEEGERIAIEDFIAFAIGAWSKAFPNETIPTNIYLVGHFTRADLPAFAEFQDSVRNWTSNIRNTFISVDHHMTLTVAFDAESETDFLVKLRDTMLLAPSNAKSLNHLGEIVGYQKLRLHDDPDEELRIKENMRELIATDWPQFRDYALRDAEVCVEYAERLIRQHTELFDKFELPITLTAFGQPLVLEGWKRAGLSETQALGREAIKSRRFIKKLGHYRTDIEQPYLDRVHWEEAFVTETYHGGRNEQFMFGIAPEGDWRDLDLSSAYTTAMSIIGLPNWSKLEIFDDLASIRFTDLAFASVYFEFPDHIRFPTLPVRTQYGIVFPRKGLSNCGAPELWLARQLGAKLKLRRGIRVPVNHDVPIFKTFIQDCIKRRGQSPKGTFNNLFWKEVGNSTYGKTAQGLRKKRVYNLSQDEMQELPECKLTQPFFASFTTSYTRAVLGELLNSLPKEAQVFSVTTDGFLTTATDTHLTKALGKPLAQSFRTARIELVGNDNVVETKHSIRQPIGWRTRGSATLKPGPADTNNIVLQKGGIKTSELMEGERENRHIVELFFNRTPDQKLEYTVGIGIKDMVRHDTDFVSRSVEKYLRMEFDWKRRPVDVRDEQVDFDGKTYRHLSFDTVPLEEVGEFDACREAWDGFNKKTKRCLRTVSEFEGFTEYMETKKLPPDISAYMGTPTKRLRRDLCRAFKNREAGFESVLSKRRVTHQEFCNALSDCGLGCKITDLDNAKRYPFEPHHSAATDEVITILQKLKDRHFPELDIEAFLPEVDDTVVEQAAA